MNTSSTMLLHNVTNLGTATDAVITIDIFYIFSLFHPWYPCLPGRYRRNSCNYLDSGQSNISSPLSGFLHSCKSDCLVLSALFSSSGWLTMICMTWTNLTYTNTCLYNIYSSLLLIMLLLAPFISAFLHNGNNLFYLQKSPRKRSTGGAGGAFDGFDNSDESETSSLCSEKSFDYGRPRPSDVSFCHCSDCQVSLLQSLSMFDVLLILSN